MAYENLKDAIKQVIKQNGNQEITGSTMQSTLLSMVDNIPEVVQESGDAENKAISQKAISREFAKTCSIRSDMSSADLSLGDEDGNAIVQFKNGHIKTKNFDSSVKSYVENKTLYLK
jgi:hypothetical protein